MPNSTSPHIFSTSVNLLGFCLLVLTSLHFANRIENSLIDEITSVVSLLLILSCLLSFVSMRSGKQRRAARLEQLAEWLFFLCLAGIFVVVVVIMTKFWSV